MAPLPALLGGLLLWVLTDGRPLLPLPLLAALLLPRRGLLLLRPWRPCRAGWAWRPCACWRTRCWTRSCWSEPPVVAFLAGCRLWALSVAGPLVLVLLPRARRRWPPRPLRRRPRLGLACWSLFRLPGLRRLLRGLGLLRARRRPGRLRALPPRRPSRGPRRRRLGRAWWPCWWRRVWGCWRARRRPLVALLVLLLMPRLCRRWLPRLRRLRLRLGLACWSFPCLLGLRRLL